MAKRDSMSEPETGRDPSQNSVSDSYRRAIETERTRLVKAEAVLGSVAFALTYSEWRCEKGTDYANVVEIARELVQESIRRLDSVNLDRMAGEHVPP
jgi:hypothetical protein